MSHAERSFDGKVALITGKVTLECYYHHVSCWSNDRFAVNPKEAAKSRLATQTCLASLSVRLMLLHDTYVSF